MKVRLNLATSPLVSHRRFTLGAFMLGLAAILALVLLSQHAYSVWSSDNAFRAQQDQYEQQIESLQQQRRTLVTFFEQPDTVQRRKRAAYLNSLIQQRAFPWIKIFTDLEHILPEGVRVISIQPKLVGDTVELRIAVGATTDDGKLKFLKTIEKAPAFSQIQLLSESHPDRPDQTDRVVLELLAVYSAA
jgi:type IV pilus assembly protein PilN